MPVVAGLHEEGEEAGGGAACNGLQHAGQASPLVVLVILPIPARRRRTRPSARSRRERRGRSRSSSRRKDATEEVTTGARRLTIR